MGFVGQAETKKIFNKFVCEVMLPMFAIPDHQSPHVALFGNSMDKDNKPIWFKKGSRSLGCAYRDFQVLTCFLFGLIDKTVTINPVNIYCVNKNFSSSCKQEDSPHNKFFWTQMYSVFFQSPFH